MGNFNRLQVTRPRHSSPKPQPMRRAGLEPAPSGIGDFSPAPPTLPLSYLRESFDLFLKTKPEKQKRHILVYFEKPQCCGCVNSSIACDSRYFPRSYKVSLKINPLNADGHGFLN